MGGQTSEAGSLIRLRDPASLRGRDPRVVGSFGVPDLACNLGTEFVLRGSNTLMLRSEEQRIGDNEEQVTFDAINICRPCDRR